MRLIVIFAVALSGCVIQNDPGHTDTACVDETFTIDPGANVDHTAGVDAGYYVTVTADGHWHLEWTCDTKLSATGCEFSGIVTFTPAVGGSNATCYQCEDNDDFSVVANDSEIDYDTLTSSGIDGIDFDTVPGSTVSASLFINSLDQSDLVYLPSGGAVVSPVCEPITLR